MALKHLKDTEVNIHNIPIMTSNFNIRDSTWDPLFPYHLIYEDTLTCCSNHLPERHSWYADFSKALSWLSSSRNYKRTRQGALAVLLLYLYKLQVVCATTISTGPYVHASTSCPITYPPCFYLKATMPCLCALISYS